MRYFSLWRILSSYSFTNTHSTWCYDTYKKASWSIARFTWILIFYISLCSLVGWYKKSYDSVFNIWDTLTIWLGQSSAFLFLLVLFFASLYLTLRISYRDLFSRVREAVPSFSAMREWILPSDDEDDLIPTKKWKQMKYIERKQKSWKRKLLKYKK